MNYHCRPPIPTCITENFCQRIPTAVFASNPCRIQYCTQEIVIFREDIVMKMCRNCVKFPSDGDIPTHVSRNKFSIFIAKVKLKQTNMKI